MANGQTAQDQNNLILDINLNVANFDFFSNQQGAGMQPNVGLLQQAAGSQPQQQQQNYQQSYANMNQSLQQQQPRPQNELEDVSNMSNMYDKMLINKTGNGLMAPQHNSVSSLASTTSSPSSMSSSSSLNVMDNGQMMRNQQTGIKLDNILPDAMDEADSLCDDYPTPSSNFLKVF